jgi:hypothetical protein
VSLGKYAILVLAAVATLLAAVWPLLPADPAGRSAVAVGGALAAFNTILAYSLVLWSSGRSTNVFLGVVLGGMVGRMALMLAAVVMGVLVFDLPKVPFAISLLAFFVLFLVLELTILHRRTSGLAGAR